MEEVPLFLLLPAVEVSAAEEVPARAFELPAAGAVVPSIKAAACSAVSNF
jgi:hypothetical protein